MNVVLISLFSKQDFGILAGDALGEMGHKLLCFSSEEETIYMKEVIEFNPDLFFVLKSQRIPFRILKIFRAIAPIVNWWPDDTRRYEFWKIQPLYDKIFLDNEDTLEKKYIPKGRDTSNIGFAYPGVYKKAFKRSEMSEGQKEWGADVVFVGSGHKNRIKMAQKVAEHCNKKGYTFKIYGNNWGDLECYTGKTAYFASCATIFNTSKITFNKHFYPLGPNRRCFEAMGSGILTILDDFIAREKFFPQAPYYKNIMQLLKLIDYYMENEGERRKKADEMYRLVHEKYKIEASLDKILRSVKK